GPESSKRSASSGAMNSRWPWRASASEARSSSGNDSPASSARSATSAAASLRVIGVDQNVGPPLGRVNRMCAASVRGSRRRQRMRAHEMSKAEVVGDDGMVTAGHRLAAEAGVEMLRRGGNAIDAAVAAAWAVGVVEPWMSGAGGVGAMVVHHHGHQLIVDFGLRAPLAARPDMYTLMPERGSQGQYGWPVVKDEENQTGHRAVGVPGVVAGL